MSSENVLDPRGEVAQGLARGLEVHRGEHHGVDGDPTTPPSTVSTIVREVNSVSVPLTVMSESSTMVGTWMPWSPSRSQRAMSRATNITRTIDHQVTPTRDPTSQATLIPSTTAATRRALAPIERTMVRSTTSSAAIGA